MTVYSPPSGWIKVDEVTYPIEGTGWGDFWLAFGPHVKCFATCRDSIRQLVEKMHAQGICVLPQGPPPVKMCRVPTKDSNYTEFILVGACQKCGTVYWAEDKPPCPEEIAAARRRAELEMLRREEQEAREVERKAEKEPLRQICKQEGHVLTSPIVQSLVVDDVAQGEVYHCDRCGSLVFGSDTDDLRS